MDNAGDKHVKTREAYEYKNEKEVERIFEQSISELRRITRSADAKERQIVLKTASKLEGKIPADIFVMEIASVLPVTSHVVHELLDKKYAQKYIGNTTSKIERGLTSSKRRKIT